MSDSIIAIKETILIGGLEYPITEKNWKYLQWQGTGYPYANNSEDFNDKRHIRVWNKHTKEHYFLEKGWPEIGEGGLVFVIFPRTDGPTNSWASYVTQHVNIKTWGGKRDGEFVRFEIKSIDKHNYCTVTDGYNKTNGGIYARDSFYTVNKITKILGI